MKAHLDLTLVPFCPGCGARMQVGPIDRENMTAPVTCVTSTCQHFGKAFEMEVPAVNLIALHDSE